MLGSITKPLIEAMPLRNAKPAHSKATNIPSLDDLQILFLENGDSSDYLISDQKGGGVFALI